MPAISFREARARVIARSLDAAARLESIAESVPIENAFGRILAAPVLADRNIPALARSIRDGFAVRSADTPGVLRVAGELRAGVAATGAAVAAGEAIEIMTGAPLPDGADAVVMIEHVGRDGDRITVSKPSAPGGFVIAEASEARQYSGRAVDDAWRCPFRYSSDG